MTVKDLIHLWEKHANGALTEETYSVKLGVNDAAKIHALQEMYPKRSKEQIINELLSAALSELETSLPYVEGNQVVSYDEQGDPIFEDIGPTPAFITLTQKHKERISQTKAN